MRFGLAGWSCASGLVKLGCMGVGPYMCGPESRVHAGRTLGWYGRVGCWAAWLD